jgi:hypothetical protein
VCSFAGLPEVGGLWRVCETLGGIRADWAGSGKKANSGIASGFLLFFCLLGLIPFHLISFHRDLLSCGFPVFCMLGGLLACWGMAD